MIFQLQLGHTIVNCPKICVVYSITHQLFLLQEWNVLGIRIACKSDLVVCVWGGGGGGGANTCSCSSSQDFSSLPSLPNLLPLLFSPIITPSPLSLPSNLLSPSLILSSTIPLPQLMEPLVVTYGTLLQEPLKSYNLSQRMRLP